jgi:hypothetical protein
MDLCSAPFERCRGNEGRVKITKMIRAGSRHAQRSDMSSGRTFPRDRVKAKGRLMAASKGSKGTIAVLAFLFGAASWICASASETGLPVMRVEAGMHAARLTDAAVDRDGRYLATVSDDRTARIWNVTSGQLLRVLRPPTGEGDEGKLVAVAMSPDSRAVAVAGSGKSGGVYVFERETGRLEKRLSGLSAVVRRLSFSSDGRWLAATFRASKGLRVWEWRTAKPALVDSEGDSSAVAWGTDERLATASLDGQIRLYRVSKSGLVRMAQMPAPGSQQPSDIVFSPNGGELAVGYVQAERVDILTSESLALDRSTAVDDIGARGGFATLAWAGSRGAIFAGATLDEKRQLPIRRWTQGGRGAQDKLPIGGIAVTRIIALPETSTGAGGVLVAGADPAWGILDAAGSWHQMQSSPTLQFDGASSSFQVSHDGRAVQFDSGMGGPQYIDIAARVLKSGTTNNLMSARTEGLPIQGWASPGHPTLAGRPLRLGDRDVSHSIAIAPNKSGFALGTDQALRYFDAKGKEVWQRPAPAPVRHVNIPAAARLLVAAYADGTLRWHRLSDGEELLTLFAHADRKRWVLWTRSGYYDASLGGEDLVGWQFNGGNDAAADFIPASGFRSRLRRPDIVDLVFDTLDGARAIAVANTVRGVRVSSDPVRMRPPAIELVSPAEISASQGRITVRYRTSASREAHPVDVRARVDGRIQPKAPNKVESEPSGDVREVIVNVPPHDSRVQLFAENPYGTSTPATVDVTWAGPTPATATVAQAAAPTFRKLCVLAVGVSNYKDKNIGRLAFPAKDAADFAAAMQQQQKSGVYAKVEVKVITDADATRENIADGLDWLQRNVAPEDVGLLFLAGHGYNDPRLGFTFLPVNADPDRLRRTAVTFRDIKSALSNLPGRAVAFLDTSRADNVFNGSRKDLSFDMNGVVDELASAENSVAVLSSSGSRQLSLEDVAWSNSAFAKALIEGIDGRVGAPGDGKVTFATLSAYVTRRVEELTQGRQSPVSRAPEGIEDLALTGPAK